MSPHFICEISESLFKMQNVLGLHFQRYLLSDCEYHMLIYLHSTYLKCEAWWVRPARCWAWQDLLSKLKNQKKNAVTFKKPLLAWKAKISCNFWTKFWNYDHGVRRGDIFHISLYECWFSKTSARSVEGKEERSGGTVDWPPKLQTNNLVGLFWLPAGCWIP